MKRSTLILCFAVWSISLVTAYYVGSRVQNAPSPATSNPTAQKQASTKTAARLIAEDEPTQVKDDTALDAYLSGDVTTLEEAMREIPTLSAQASRELLNDAFALPMSDPNRTRLIRELLGQLAETDPMGALEIASQIKSLRDSERARVSVLEVWGRNDPAAAMAWANTALAGETARTRSSQLSAIYRGFAASNPAAAFQQALQITDDNRLKNRLLSQVIEVQIETGGLQAAKLAIDLVSDPDTQSSLRRELVDEWASFDPVAAASYVLSLGEDASDHLKSTLVSEWAESDPAAAAAWLSHLAEDDPAIARASAAIIQEWTRYDLAASAEWLNSLPASPELDRAVISYTFSAAQEDPGTAMTWAESIEDDRRRTFMMERVAATWKEQDTDSFNTYLNSSDLTAEQRTTLENAQSYRGGRGGPGGGGGGRGRN